MEISGARQAAAAAVSGGSSKHAHHGEETERQQDQRQVADPDEYRQQADGLAQSEVCQNNQNVRQGLIDAHQREAEGPLRAPEIQRIAAAFQGRGHAGNHAEVGDVVVEVHAAGVQFGAQRPGIQRQHGKQDAQGREDFPG